MEAFEKSEFNVLTFINAFEKSEFSYGAPMLAFEKSEFTYRGTLQAYEKSEFFYFIPEVYDQLTFGNGGGTAETEYLQYIQPVTWFKLTQNNGTNYTPWIKSLHLTKTLNGKTYVDVEMIEYGDGVITDFINDIGQGISSDKIVSSQPQITNPIFSSMCSFPLKYHGFSTSRYFILEMSVGYPGLQTQSWTAPYLLPSTLSFDGTILKVKFEDFTVLLEQENQNMSPDLDADNGIKRSAHSVTKEICTKYNIPNVVLSYPDYTVRLLRRTQGKPLDWVDKLSNIYRAKRNWVGNTLYIKPILTADEQAAKWNLTGHLHIMDDGFDIDVDLSQYKNKFTIIRTSSNGGIIGRQKCTGPQCPGRTGDITFDFPVNYASATAQVESGDLENFVYFTETGTVVSGTPINSPSGMAILSEVPVSNVKFTYRPRIGATPLQQDGASSSAQNFQAPGSNLGLFSYTPEYEVIYRGGKNNTNNGIDADYKFAAEDTAGIACLGLHEEYADIEDPIIPNTSVAQDYVAALLKEATRRILILKMNTPWVNPFIEAGDCIGITDHETKQEGMKWLAEEVSISIEGNDSQMSLTLTRGRT